MGFITILSISQAETKEIGSVLNVQCFLRPLITFEAICYQLFFVQRLCFKPATGNTYLLRVFALPVCSSFHTPNAVKLKTLQLMEKNSREHNWSPGKENMLPKPINWSGRKGGWLVLLILLFAQVIPNAGFKYSVFVLGVVQDNGRYIKAPAGNDFVVSDEPQLSTQAWFGDVERWATVNSKSQLLPDYSMVL